ncbi:MAG: hypothetical protein ABEJ69_02140 [Candidatus Nanohaloarchaea archaeon]
MALNRLSRIRENRLLTVLSAMVVILAAFSGFAAFKLVQLENQVATMKSSSPEPQEVLAQGTPSYGDELKVSFEDVSQSKPQTTEETISKLASLDSTELSTENKQRLVHILYEMENGISCEYCCEARAIVTKDGGAGCGCSHAVAMRGLAKYLLKEHPEMSDREIFREVAKWKTRYFPDQTLSKAEALEKRGVEPTFVNLASNNYRGVSSREGGWAGDC